MTLQFVNPLGGEGPTSEYLVQVDTNLEYPFLLTESDAERGEEAGIIETPPVAPTLTSLTPSTAETGTPAVTVAIAGSGFTSSSAVTVAGAAVGSTFVSDAEVDISIDPTSASAGTVPVVVTNDTESSGPLDFTFTTPAPPPE